MDSRTPRKPGGTRRARAWTVLALGLFALLGVQCDRTVRTTLVAAGLSSPVFLTAPAGDPRLFVVERRGTVVVIDGNGTVLPGFFLDIRGLVGTSGEGGLLGLAFAPDYAASGELYVYYTDPANDSVLARYRRDPADPGRADPASGEVVALVDQPDATTNHRGGTIAFSPVDGMLYWGLGDGGGGGDPNDLAQDPTTPLGKMLRLDVSGGPGTSYAIPPDNPFAGPDGVLDEIWALGFRNPFRFSFDRETGDLWVGDVGQGAREEVDHEPAGDPGGNNYGWDVHEGTLCFDPKPGLPCEDPANPVSFRFPVHEYATHVAGTCAITGGVVYRGSVPFLVGSYLFADFCTNRIGSLGPGGVMDLTDPLAPTAGSIDGVVAFGEDGAGEVYLVSLRSGSVHRIQ